MFGEGLHEPIQPVALGDTANGVQLSLPRLVAGTVATTSDPACPCNLLRASRKWLERCVLVYLSYQCCVDGRKR
jgi:hypothetical protein